MQKILVVLSIVGAGLGFAYTVAATIVMSMAPSYATTESLRHTQVMAYENATRQATADHVLASTRCDRMVHPEKVNCKTEGKTAVALARKTASHNYKEGIVPASASVRKIPQRVRDIDPALYLAHRQFRE